MRFERRKIEKKRRSDWFSHSNIGQNQGIKRRSNQGKWTKVDSLEPRWSREPDGIHIDVEFTPICIDLPFGPVQVDVEFPPEICVDAEFPMTDQEYSMMMAEFKDRNSARVQEEIRRHFVGGESIRDIAKAVGIGKSQVAKDLSNFKKVKMGRLTADLEIDKVAFDVFIEVVEQARARMKEHWKKYQAIEEMIHVLGPTLRREQGKEHTRRCRNYGEVKEESREVRNLIDTQNRLLQQLRAESAQILELVKSFGLTDSENVEQLFQKNLHAIEEEVTAFLIEIGVILSSELDGEGELKHRVLGRMSAFLRSKDVFKRATDAKEKIADELGI